MNKKRVLGVDIGNVIINHRGQKIADEKGREIVNEQYSSIPSTEGVFDALKELNTDFNGQVYLISKCTEWAEERILKWLVDNDFYTKTDVDPKHVRFVRERHEKDPLCRKLGITHFIDDRLEVLSHMVESTPHLYLFQPKQEEVEEFRQFLPKVIVVQNWQEVLKAINF